MSRPESWTFLGGTGSWSYTLFDILRHWVNHWLYKYLSKRFISCSNLRILEAGSGPAFSSSLFSKDQRVGMSIAVDIDINALREARRRDPDLPVVVGDLCHLPFPDEIFDLVWNSSTIEHLDRPTNALKEMSRITKRGGLLFVGVPNQYGPLGFQKWINNSRLGIWLGPVYKDKQLNRMFTNFGLKHEETVYYFFRFFLGILARKP